MAQDDHFAPDANRVVTGGMSSEARAPLVSANTASPTQWPAVPLRRRSQTVTVAV